MQFITHLNTFVCVAMCTCDFMPLLKGPEQARIFSFFTVNGSIRIKIRENGPYNFMTHIDDVKDIFPDKDLLVFCQNQLLGPALSKGFSSLDMSYFIGIFVGDQYLQATIMLVICNGITFHSKSSHVCFYIFIKLLL